MSEWKTSWLSQHPLKLSMYYYISITDGGFRPINTGWRDVFGPTLFTVLGQNSLVYKSNQRRIHFIYILVSKKTIECESLVWRGKPGKSCSFLVWPHLLIFSQCTQYTRYHTIVQNAVLLRFLKKSFICDGVDELSYIYEPPSVIYLLFSCMRALSISCSQTELFLSLHRCTILQGFSVCLRAENTVQSLQGWGFYAVLGWML